MTEMSETAKRAKKMNMTVQYYVLARVRVEALYPNDSEARAFCLADWPEGDAHLAWLCSAPMHEIADWVRAGLKRRMTTIDAARRFGCARRTVQKWCKVLGFRREGRDYYLDAEKVTAIRDAMGAAHPGGRPADSTRRYFGCEK